MVGSLADRTFQLRLRAACLFGTRRTQRPRATSSASRGTAPSSRRSGSPCLRLGRTTSALVTFRSSSTTSIPSKRRCRKPPSHCEALWRANTQDRLMTNGTPGVFREAKRPAVISTICVRKFALSTLRGVVSSGLRWQLALL